MSDATLQPASTSGTADLSGCELGDFRLLRRLGYGAMAEVYLAEQCQLKRRVAVKILKPELADDQTYLKRFEREAQAAASLVHANIVQIHEVGHVGRLHYIVQEYVQGQNLREWLARHGPPDLAHALAIMRQVAAALAKAAEREVVHRDIKPENIMLTAAGEVKVADFGLARLPREEAADLTQVGMTMGTPLYMSPEQVEGRTLDPRSDLYSFGVTCYQMLAGSPPFTGDTALAVAVQHLNKEPPPLETVRPDLPPVLCRTVHKMLAKNPAHRHQSSRELLVELCRIRLQCDVENGSEDLAAWESLGVQSLAKSQLQAVQRLEALMKSIKAARRGRRSRLYLLASMLMAAVLGAGLAWSMSRQPSLLAKPAGETLRIPRQPSALRQWYYASQIGTEEAWRSVIEYFPEKEYLGGWAREQSARVYLRELDYDRALAVFDELAAMSDSEKEFRAFGLAGKCGVLTLQGKYRESADVLDELWPLHQELRDPQMRKMLEYVMRENRAKLGPQTGRQWDQWLSEQFN